MAVSTILFIPVALAVIIACLPFIRDFGQCSRACTIHYDKQMFSSRQITGVWRFDNRMCDCYEGNALLEGGVPRLYAEIERGYPYISRNKQVCGVKESDLARNEWSSGTTYDSKVEASKMGAKVANCGVCGRCSTQHDVGRFAQYSDTIAKVVGPCIVATLLGGSWLDRICMTMRADFTPGCTDCWVEDHGCLLAHCYGDCLLQSGTWRNAFTTLGKKDAAAGWKGDMCVDCMERFCSKPYIDSCGANRRTAGVKTDIERSQSEMCADAELVPPWP
jgi:hypothetical protein